jgi:hypothetical protein
LYMKQKNMIISTWIGLLVIGLLFSAVFVNAERSDLFTQDFEQEGWTWEDPPTGWSTSTYFYFNSLYGEPHSGNQWAYSYSNNDSMVSPTVTFGMDTELSFWYAIDNQGFPQSLEVYLDGKDGGTLIWSDYDFSHSTYQQAIVDLTDYTGDHFIEFVNAGPTGLYGHVIDTIILTAEGVDESSSEEKPPSNGESNPPSSPPPSSPPPAAPQNPIASFTVSESIAFVNTEITFDASGSTTPDGEVLTYLWDFGDSYEDTGMIVNHSYETTGIYVVNLKVTDNNDLSDSTSKEIVINNAGNNPPKNPSVRSSVDPSDFEVDTEYSFEFSSIDLDGDRIKFTINWGDETLVNTDFPSEQESFTHQENLTYEWDKAGVYIISARAIDEQNATSELTTLPVFVDVDVIPIDDMIRGYLVDFYRNNSVTHFYNSDTEVYTLVYSQGSKDSSDQRDPDSGLTSPSEVFYLIDVAGDGDFDYKYGRSSGLTRYELNDSEESIDGGIDNKSEAADPDETPGFLLPISVFSVILVFLIYVKKRVKL